MTKQNKTKIMFLCVKNVPKIEMPMVDMERFKKILIFNQKKKKDTQGR